MSAILMLIAGACIIKAGLFVQSGTPDSLQWKTITTGICFIVAITTYFSDPREWITYIWCFNTVAWAATTYLESRIVALSQCSSRYEEWRKKFDNK